MTTSVVFVLDPAFGDRVAALAKEMPVWVVSSPINDLAVRHVHENGGAECVTLLKTRKDETPINLLIRGLYAIDEHHGEASQSKSYDTVRVYGATEALPEAVASELLFRKVTATADGFQAER